MVQLRVSTTLLEDYEENVDFQVPKPSVYMTWSSMSSNLYYPELHAGVDRAGNLNIFYDSRTYDAQNLQITNLYRDATTLQWIEETTPNPGIIDFLPTESGTFPRCKTARNPISGNLAVVYGTTSNDGSCHCLFLDLSARYPQWQSVPPLLISGSAYLQDVDLAFDNAGTAVVIISVCLVSQSAWKCWKWFPSLGQAASALTVIPELTIDVLGAASINALWYGQYQDTTVNSDGSPCEGYYLTAFTSPGVGYNNGYRATEGSKSAITANSVTGYGGGVNLGLFMNFDWVFLDDPNTAPLGFATTVADSTSLTPFQNEVLFIINNAYGGTAPVSNVRHLFTDLPSDVRRTPLWARGLVVSQQSPPSEKLEDPFTVHAFAAFQLPDTSFEVWHTESVPGGVNEIQDGIFDIPESNWTMSDRITANILSGKDMPFVPRPTFFQSLTPIFDVLVVDNAPTVVLINPARMIDVFTKEAENGEWIMSTVQTPQSQAPVSGETVIKEHRKPRQQKKSQSRGLPKLSDDVQTFNTYYTDITTVLPDGSPLGNLNILIGSDSDMILNINRRDYGVGPTRTASVTLGPNGRMGVSLPTQGSLLPPSFWVWAEGMDIEAKVDIQPGPTDVHDTLADVGTPGHQSLTDIMVNGTPLVPANTPPGSVTDATASLHAISEMITSDATASPEDQQYIYKTTSLQVARARSPKGSKRLGQLRSDRALAFHIDFRNGIKFSKLSESKTVDGKQLPGDIFNFFEDLGDLVGDFVDDVIDLVEVTVDGVNVAIQYLKDKITHTWNAIVDFASQAADLVVVVFHKIGVAIADVYDWLRFAYDWGDIQNSARYIQQLFAVTTNECPTLIQNYLQQLTADAFTYAKENVASVLKAAETVLSQTTPGQFVTNVSVAPSGPEGNKAKVGSGLTVSPQDLIDNLHPASTWIMQKVQDLLSSFKLNWPDSEGSENFFSIIDKFNEIIANEQENGGFENAANAMMSFVTNCQSQGLFNSTTLASILEVFAALVELSIDLAQAFVSALGELFAYAIKNMAVAFQTVIPLPPVTFLYEQIMGGDECTLGALCSLVMAVPFTLMYKSITGTAPFPSSEMGQTAVSGTEELAIGIFKVIGSVVNGLIEFATYRAGNLYAESLQSSFTSVLLGLGTGGPAVLESKPTGLARPNITARSLSAQTTRDFSLSLEHLILADEAFAYAITITGLILSKVGLQRGSVISSVLRSMLGAVLIGLYADQATGGMDNEKEKLETIAGLLSGVHSSTAFLNFVPMPAPALIGVICVRAATGVTAGTLLIEASKLPDDEIATESEVTRKAIDK